MTYLRDALFSRNIFARKWGFDDGIIRKAFRLLESKDKPLTISFRCWELVELTSLPPRANKNNQRKKRIMSPKILRHFITQICPVVQCKSLFEFHVLPG